MESDARPPERMSDAGSIAQNWKRWKQAFLDYMKVNGGINKPEDEKVAWLKNLIGQVGLEAFENISFQNPEDEDNLTIVMEKLDLIFGPPKSVVEERYKFFSRSKKNNESIDDYVDDLKVFAKFCNFGDQEESFIIDAVVLNIKDKNLHKLIFGDENLNLEKLKLVYKTYEICAGKMKDKSNELVPGKSNTKKRNARRGSPASRASSTPRASSAPRSSTAPIESNNPCRKCGQRHAYKACPAWNFICTYCKIKGHFSHQCPRPEVDRRKQTGPLIPPRNNLASLFRTNKDSEVQVEDKNNLGSVTNVDKPEVN